MLRENMVRRRGFESRISARQMRYHYTTGEPTEIVGEIALFQPYLYLLGGEVVIRPVDWIGF